MRLGWKKSVVLCSLRMCFPFPLDLGRFCLCLRMFWSSDSSLSNVRLRLFPLQRADRTANRTFSSPFSIPFFASFSSPSLSRWANRLLVPKKRCCFPEKGSGVSLPSLLFLSSPPCKFSTSTVLFWVGLPLGFGARRALFCFPFHPGKSFRFLVWNLFFSFSRVPAGGTYLFFLAGVSFTPSAAKCGRLSKTVDMFLTFFFFGARRRV